MVTLRDLKQTLMDEVLSQHSSNLLFVLRELLKQSRQDLHLALEEDVLVSRRLLLRLSGDDLLRQLLDQLDRLNLQRKQSMNWQLGDEILKGIVE